MVKREQNERERKRQLSYFWSIFEQNLKLRFVKLLIGFCFIIRAWVGRKEIFSDLGNYAAAIAVQENGKERNLKQQLSCEKKKSSAWVAAIPQRIPLLQISAVFLFSPTLKGRKSWMINGRMTIVGFVFQLELPRS